MLECEMSFLTDLDGLQWVEYTTDPQLGYAVSRNDSIVEGYEEFYRITYEFHLEVLDPDVAVGGRYECRNLLSPLTCASAEFAVIRETLLFIAAESLLT